MGKIKIYHFHNGKGGGVMSVITNLLRFSNNVSIENHVIYTINAAEQKSFVQPELKGAASQQIFYFSPKWNFYFTCKQLSLLIPDDNAVLVAHDWLELGMISNLGLQNPVVQVLHGNYAYYHQLAIKHRQSIDRFITVSSKIFDTLSRELPERATDIQYCKFPVPDTNKKISGSDTERLKIFYCVKYLNDDNKQFALLPQIDKRLQEKGIEVEWTIVGEGYDAIPEENKWSDKSIVSMYANIENKKVLELLSVQNLFILPSVNEGFPVSVVEAMKTGVVPLVTNWAGATDELVIQDQTGFLFSVGDSESYADIIAALDKDRIKLATMSIQAEKVAKELFDPYKNTEVYENIFTSIKKVKQKKAFKAYGSRLDSKWIPNAITNFIRTL